MKNRFGGSNKESGSKHIIISIVIMLVLVIGFTIAINGTSEDTIVREQKTLSDAIDRSIYHCYAIEGVYPESLEYLKENYGLTYDEDTFFVDYTPIGGNVMPSYTIIYKGE